MQPRFIRQKDAPAYLGMSVPVFNKMVRPYVTQIPNGRAVSYDRLDLDAWADQYKAAYGKPGKEMPQWEREPRGFESGGTSGAYAKPSSPSRFEQAVERFKLKQKAATKKDKGSPGGRRRGQDPKGT
jgi:hypothetical protein